MRNRIIMFMLIVSSGIPLQTLGWGFYAHRKINYISVFSLPPEMVKYYKSNIEYIVDRSTAPDQRRYVVDGEACRHFMDIDHYGVYPFEEVPHDFDSAVAKFTLDTLTEYGIVPWHVQVMYNRLVWSFRKQDPAEILKNSAELGHYIADACVPLHATCNHNGQLTDQVGIHALWESSIPELLEEKNFDLFVGKAEIVNDLSPYVWTVFLESAYLSDSVLKSEMYVTKQFGEANKYAVIDRGKAIIRSYSPEFVKEYNRHMGDMVESRMRRAISAISSLWYSAWVQAGQPTLIFDGSQIEDKELQELNMKWNTVGKGFGREHE